MAAKRRTTESPSKPRKSSQSLTPMYVGGGLLVCALGGLVWWSLPGNHAEDSNDAGTETDAAEAISDREEDAAPPKTKNQIDRPPKASAELAIFSSKTEEEIAQIATASEIAKHLEPRHCGGACDAVKKFLEDEDSFDVDTMPTEDLILPPKELYDTVAAGLTPVQKDSILLKKNAAVVHITANIDANVIGARAAFATAAVLAELLDGFVWDETGRRIETKDEMLSHCITAPLGQNGFSPRQIVVQLAKGEDGTARLMSAGMLRFGSPDLSLHGASLASAPLLANVINVAAMQITNGKKAGPFTITLDDVAKVTGRKPADLSLNPKDARSVVLDILDADRAEGDPDNDLAELVPNNGASRENWDLVVASLFGSASSAPAGDDAELADVAKKTQATLPDAIKRFQGGEGAFFVKGPFPIAEDNRVDGGPATEQLWVHVASCDDQSCTGVPSDEPTYAPNLAAAKSTSLKRSSTVDWLIQERDGGAAGGESIKLLKSRATGK